jgi:hypothetical protein
VLDMQHAYGNVDLFDEGAMPEGNTWKPRIRIH